MGKRGGFVVPPRWGKLSSWSTFVFSWPKVDRLGRSSTWQLCVRHWPESRVQSPTFRVFHHVLHSQDLPTPKLTWVKICEWLLGLSASGSSGSTMFSFCFATPFTSCVFNQMTPQNIQTANPAPSILYSWQGLVTEKAHSPNNEYQQALFATLVIWVGLFLLEFLEIIKI